MNSKAVFEILVLGGIVTFLATGDLANAQQLICSPGVGTIEQCQELLAQLRSQQALAEFRIRELRNRAPRLSPIVRQRDRGCPLFVEESPLICHMGQEEAVEYCRRLAPEVGSHLPTPLELALVARSRGALGPRRTANRGYYPIYTINDLNQRIVDFYFNHTGYSRPADDPRDHFFWSYSPSSVSSFSYVVYALHGDGSLAPVEIDRPSSYNYSAVRCVVHE